MLGIEAISKVVIALFKIAWDIKNSLLKFDVGDIPRIWDAIRQGQGVMGNAKQAAKEFRDLDPVEIQIVGKLVDAEFAARGIHIENIDALIDKALTAVDALWDFMELLPKKKVDSTIP